jgi:hypothetical protein
MTYFADFNAPPLSKWLPCYDKGREGIKCASLARKSYPTETFLNKNLKFTSSNLAFEPIWALRFGGQKQRYVHSLLHTQPQSFGIPVCMIGVHNQKKKT